MLSNRSTPKTRTVPEQVKNRTQTGRPKNTENIQFKKKSYHVHPCKSRFQTIKQNYVNFSHLYSILRVNIAK